MDVEDIENFFPQSNKSDQKEEKPKSSKRKHSDSKKDPKEDPEDEKEQIRKQCKFYCGSPAEWNIIRKYKFDRQKEYVEEKRFLEEKNLRETVFNATHNVFGVVLDYVTNGDGYVEKEIQNDLSLRHAIEEEFQNILYLFNNKIKILFLTTIDVWNAKRLQLRERPAKPSIVIEEEEPIQGINSNQREQAPEEMS